MLAHDVADRLTVGHVEDVNLRAVAELVLDEIRLTPNVKLSKDYLLTGVDAALGSVQADKPHAARNKDHVPQDLHSSVSAGNCRAFVAGA
jgi:hypothetical protein